MKSPFKLRSNSASGENRRRWRSRVSLLGHFARRGATTCRRGPERRRQTPAAPAAAPGCDDPQPRRTHPRRPPDISPAMHAGDDPALPHRDRSRHHASRLYQLGDRRRRLRLRRRKQRAVQTPAEHQQRAVWRRAMISTGSNSSGRIGTFTMDGHGIFGNHDYDLKLDLTDEKIGLYPRRIHGVSHLV